jgi:hypothetical protein
VALPSHRAVDRFRRLAVARVPSPRHPDWVHCRAKGDVAGAVDLNRHLLRGDRRLRSVAKGDDCELRTESTGVEDKLRRQFAAGEVIALLGERDALRLLRECDIAEQHVP